MKSPRIYLYKITFEEIPDWYWGVHKEKKFGEFYMGSPHTHAWKWKFYTPKKQILQFFEYNEEGWRQANLIEDRLIRPDLNNPLCLNESVSGHYSLEAASRGGKIGGKKTHKDKTEDGKSKHGLRCAKASNASMPPEQKSKYGRETAKRLNAKKDDQGRSVNAVKGAEACNKEKDDQGRSINAVKRAKAALASMTPEEITERARKGGEAVSKQVWESTIDGFRGRACSVALHNKANGWDLNSRRRIS
jgi:hypothetical protein